MKDIIIVCAGIYGKEVLSVINAINNYSEREEGKRKYNILGYIDDNPNALNDSDDGIPLLGSIETWEPKGKEVYAIGLSNPQTKRAIAKKLKKRGCFFETLVAPWSIVDSNTTFGEGCFVTAFYISKYATIGNFVNINGSMICPGAEIGDYCTTTGFSVIEDAFIGEAVFIGSHAVVSEGVHVGDEAKISVGSIVNTDVEKATTVFGVPAKPL